MSTPEKPRPSLDAVLADSDERIGQFVRSMLGPPATTGEPPYTHVHALSSTEDEIAAAPGPSYTVSEPGRGWLARALHRLFGDGAP